LQAARAASRKTFVLKFAPKWGGRHRPITLEHMSEHHLSDDMSLPSRNTNVSSTTNHAATQCMQQPARREAS